VQTVSSCSWLAQTRYVWECGTYLVDFNRVSVREAEIGEVKAQGSRAVNVKKSFTGSEQGGERGIDEGVVFEKEAVGECIAVKERVGLVLPDNCDGMKGWKVLIVDRKVCDAV
jgi:hypothetical protein